jgi:L-asparagine transporter-like permease
MPSVFAAWAMVALNTLAGYLLFEYAFDKESKIFTLVVFGGVTLRLLVIMALVLVINLLHMVRSIDFVVSFISFYCIYLVLEVLGYQKRNQLKKKLQETDQRHAS